MPEQYILLEEIKQLEQRFRTNLINSLTGFKSVALIGTQSKAGTTNVAIFSQIIHVGANPPLLGILFRPHTVPRHTLENILATRDFTINHIQASFVRQAHHTSANWDSSEFDACGFTPQYSRNLSAPYVQQANIKIGLQLAERKDLDTNGTVFIVGAVQELMLPGEVIAPDGYVDLEQAGSLTCSGLDAYHQTQKVVRLSYAKPDHTPKDIG